MSKTWIRKHYGNNYGNINDTMYYVSKRNKYGIVWIVKDCHTNMWSISTSSSHGLNGKSENTPSYDIIVI